MQGERQRDELLKAAVQFWPGGVIPGNLGRPRLAPAPIDTQSGLPVIARMVWDQAEELMPARAVRWTRTAALVRIQAPGVEPGQPEVVGWLRIPDVSSSIPPRPAGGWYHGHVNHLNLLDVRQERWPASSPLNERQPRRISVRVQGDSPVIVRLLWHEHEELLPARAIRWSGQSLDDSAMVVIQPPRGPAVAELVCWLAMRDASATIPRRSRVPILHVRDDSRARRRRKVG
ncbi:hypothetical protein [Promicromonospora soli]